MLLSPVDIAALTIPRPARRRLDLRRLTPHHIVVNRVNRVMKWLGATAFLFTWAGACGGDATSGGATSSVPDPTLSSIQSAIFTPTCAGFTACHASANDGGHCDLRAGHARGDLVGRSSFVKSSNVLVVPGHPEESFLVRKLRGQLADGEGARMPYHSAIESVQRIQGLPGTFGRSFETWW